MPPLTLTAEKHTIEFDGFNIAKFTLHGPDFDWSFDQLEDWLPAPTSPIESLALVFSANTTARVSFSLYKVGAFMPDLSAKSIIGYLSSQGGNVPKAFSLQTPIPPDAGNINPAVMAGMPLQSVDYQTLLNGVLLDHRDWFVDLRGKYLLVVRLACPPRFMNKLQQQVQFFLLRSNVDKGLGVTEAPPPAPPPEKPSNG